MNLFLSTVIIPSMIITAFSTIMMSNIIMIWFIMEINNFMFISYMIIKMKQKKMIFLYFLIQIMGSFMILFSFISNPIKLIYINNIIIFMSLFLKTGIPPLHLWMPMMSKFMLWMPIFFMLTIQKISPLMMFYLMNIKEELIMFLMIMTMIIPPLSMINNKNMKMLMSYSSINQTGWMVMLIYLKHQFWFIYFITYTAIILMISMILNHTNISMKFFQYTLKKLNLMFTVMMMNLASMPPFSFFMFKWFSTFTLIMNSNLKMIIIIMLLNSLLMTFIYIKMMMWSLFMNKFESKLISKKSTIKLMNNLWTTLLILTPLLMIM